jgi:Flp pilus assembly protein TadG
VVVVSLSRRRLRARRRRGADDTRGAVAIIVAASMLVVLGLAAIVVDLGFARDRARVAQNAADAAALAVAICYTAPTGCPDPQGTARAYVTANGWTYSPSTVSVDTAAQTVTVGLQAAAPPGFFAGALGYTNARVGGSARATWSGATAVACALCVLGDFDGQVGDVTLAGSLVVDGDIDFNDPGGTVTVNGPPGTGVFYGGTVTGGSYTVNGTPVTPVARTVPLPDPLAGLTLPPPTGVEGVNLGATATRGPGGPRPVVCPQGNYIDFSACDALQGNGIYIVTGPVGGGAVEIPNGTASNTLVYLTCNDGANRPRNCNPGEKGGYLGGRSRFTSTVTARTAGAYAGYAVIYDRNNSPDRNDARVSGNSTLTINGNLYGASATVDFRGSGDMTVAGFAVVGGVTLSGNGAPATHIDVSASGGPQTLTAPIPPHLVP